ncbi:MAG TPA: glycoside hydrolase family 76 [Corynebacterium urealyticum]|nr:glycoside hydrolase family 76 [Corynebacterium urealyticum]
MHERWDHRADLAQQAITDRHASKVWGVPRTNLAVIAWPPLARDKAFYRWHYWWQAHYVDCQVDATRRRPSKARQRELRATLRGMRLRNLAPLTRNNYYDDKAWLALAMWRAEQYTKVKRVSARKDLEENILEGVDSLTGVLPWRSNETFYNVPTNGPVAIMAARTGRLDLARQLVDWIWENMLNEDGLVMDGLWMRMNGPVPEPTIHSYCQGVALGACVELAVAEREQASVGEGEVSEVGMDYIYRACGLIDAISEHLTNSNDVINASTAGGDGGLFNGILVRYLALAVEKLPELGPRTRKARSQARRIVLQSAESAWRFRLEVDGLPVFPSRWDRDATLPHSGGLVGATIAGAVASSDIAERDLSVQLSGWKLMEAAARITALEAAQHEQRN